MTLAFVALIALRVAVGYHFFKEGTGKLRSGTFNAQYFLQGAKGPLAPIFQSLVEDVDGKVRLCVKREELVDGQVKYKIDTDLSFMLWNDFLDQAQSYYRFGSADLEEKLIERRRLLAEKIATAREQKDASVNTAQLEQDRRTDEANIHKLRNQIKNGNEIRDGHKDQLRDWLAINQTELISHFGTADRLLGFERDGQNRSHVATYVPSLREQVDTIRAERQKKLGGWVAEVEGIWDSYQNQINSLAVDTQAEKPPLALHRPFDQEYSRLKVINTIIPWFDTIVGVLLIIGLFTRIASLAAAGFLGSVILSQPPWIPGTKPTYYECVEFFALLVIFAMCAGRYGGLDFFFTSKPRPEPDEN